MDKIANTSIDSFFGGNVKIEQPIDGYRAGMDAVLLASAASAICASSICELGAGVGTAIIGAIAQSNLSIEKAAGIEIDGNAAKLLRNNIAINHIEIPFLIHENNGLYPIPELDGQFELVISNPPFFDDEKSIRGPKDARKSAYIIGAPLEDWIKAMLRLAKAKGRILLIHRADRINDILSALKNRAGDIRLFPIRPNSDGPANRILISATKANRAPTQIFAGLDIHSKNSQSEFTEIAKEIFAGGNLQIWDCLK